MGKRIDDVIERYQQSAWNFYRKKKKFESVKAQYEKLKEEFESEMDNMFSECGKRRVVFEGIELDDNGTGRLVVNKVEKTSIEWYADKLEKKVTKPIARKLIKKKYTIADMKGLTEYLKSCGVNPNVFRQYLNVEKTVDTKMVDQLGNIGELSVKQISGCYIVKCHKPYFTLSVKKDSDDGETE